MMLADLPPVATDPEMLRRAFGLFLLVVVLAVTAAFASFSGKELDYEQQMLRIYAKKAPKKPLKEKLANLLLFWKRKRNI